MRGSFHHERLQVAVHEKLLLASEEAARHTAWHAAHAGAVAAGDLRVPSAVTWGGNVRNVSTFYQ